MSEIGWVHTVFALVALGSGGVVVLLPKGTRWHRTVGHLYGTAMLGVVASAFAIYDLFGGFGPFHVAALVAAGTLTMGLGYALIRRPRRWMEHHAHWMSWSYIGLLAAFAAETLTRVGMPLLAPRFAGTGAWTAFWVLVGVAIAAAVGLGAWLVRRRMPGALRQAATAMRREASAPALGATLEQS